MEFVQDYFECDACQNRKFMKVYEFSMRFRGVNFSDEFFYDKVTDEMYQCIACNKIFTKDQIEEGLLSFKRIRKKAG
ncbi:MAG: hypothetical protein JRH06_02650 [Deltaproteobacteria bacterium]|nr:hypothetical protein [Deltaproteobacteria bacterium]MBW2136439.1 hypothetical protein [Deltaproteobacteria bacterium]